MPTNGSPISLPTAWKTRISVFVITAGEVSALR